MNSLSLLGSSFSQADQAVEWNTFSLPQVLVDCLLFHPEVEIERRGYRRCGIRGHSLPHGP